MFGSDTIEIIIGMTFVFLTLSLICSALREFIEAWYKHRAKDLEQGIRELLGDPKNDTGFVERLYDHGLVNCLFKGSYASSKTSDLPSYIPARNFTLAALDLVKNPPAGLGTAAIRLPPNLETALRTLTEEAGNDINKLQAGLEDWYNSAMDRVAGWYRRRTQWILFGLGLIVAVSMNADSLYIGRALSNDPSIRKALVASAQARAGKPIEEDKISRSEIDNDLGELRSLRLPIGWGGRPDMPAPPQSLSQVPNYAMQVTVNHSFGWLLTAVAISFGAPFWFDLLNKLIVVRSTVKPHEKSQEEGSKDAETPKE